MKHFFKIMFGYIHDLEVDPISQYRFNLFFTWVWFIAMPVVGFIVPHNDNREVVALCILEISLWANFISHFTGVASSIPAIIEMHREDEMNKSTVRPFFRSLFLAWRAKRGSEINNPNYQPDILHDQADHLNYIDEIAAEVEAEF